MDSPNTQPSTKLSIKFSLSLYSCLIFLFMFPSWIMRSHDPSLLRFIPSLFNCIGTLETLFLCLYQVFMSVALLGTAFIKFKKSPKKLLKLRDLQSYWSVALCCLSHRANHYSWFFLTTMHEGACWLTSTTFKR